MWLFFSNTAARRADELSRPSTSLDHGASLAPPLGRAAELIAARRPRQRRHQRGNTSDDGVAPRCDLCAQKWVFVIAAGGRTGSTSILEGLNALPGVSLQGENFALINDLRQVYGKVKRLVEMNQQPGGNAVYFLRETRGVVDDALCTQQSLMASLASGGNLSGQGSAPHILGFKELVALPSMDDGVHEHLSSTDMEWLDYLNVLFPCSRIVFNVRRDHAAQAEAMFHLFRAAKGNRTVSKHARVSELEKELGELYGRVLQWHSRFREEGRSFLMHTENDFSPEGFTRLAHWLELPCTFSSVPRANEPEPSKAHQRSAAYGASKEPTNVTCSPFQQSSWTTGPEPSSRGDGEDDEEDCDGLEQLPSNEACVDAHGVSLLRSPRRVGSTSAKLDLASLPKFYLHEGGAFNFSDTVDCYFRAFGISPSADVVDDVLDADAAEHLADHWMLEQFRRHGSRVMDPNQAQLHVIGTPFATAFRAHAALRNDADFKVRAGGRLDGPLGCGTLETYRNRTAALAAELRESAEWRRHGGMDFLLLNSFYQITQALGEELSQLLTAAPAIFTSSDNDYLDIKAVSNATGGPAVIIPYKADSRLEDFARSPARETARQTTVMFHGTVSHGRQSARHGALTEQRRRICERLAPELGGNTSLHCVEKRWPGPADPATALAYTNATLCLVPAGDTPSSRRLFDSMAAGCVPVLLTSPASIAPNLPFPASVDWRGAALLGGEPSCALSDAKLNDTVAWLQGLLEPRNARALRCMRTQAQLVFRERLSYRGDGVVSALLYELQHDARYEGMLASTS